MCLFSLTLTAIAHDIEFKDVQDWAVAPSSSTNPPQIMEELKEHVRCMMYGRKPAAMFLRHKATNNGLIEQISDKVMTIAKSILNLSL